MDKYAIIETTSTHVPGDLRSQQFPGHGYPAHTVTNETIREFETREKWEEWIRDAAAPKFGQPKKFRAIIFRDVEIACDVNINIT